MACLLVVQAGCVRSGRAADTAAGAESRYRDPAALQTLISKKTEPYYLVDVRGYDEYAGGHIPTAVCIPVDEIGDRPPTQTRSTLIVVYCASGVRSAKAWKTLVDLGYTRVIDFGEISRWKSTSAQGSEPGDCPCLSL